MNSVTLSNKANVDIWHYRLGQASFDIVERTLRSCNLPYEIKSSSTLCSSCLKAKCHKLPFTISETVTHHPLELIHTDLWGPSPVKSRNGFTYYVSFIDNFSRFTWLYLLKSKSDVYNAFLHFKSLVET